MKMNNCEKDHNDNDEDKSNDNTTDKDNNNQPANLCNTLLDRLEEKPKALVLLLFFLCVVTKELTLLNCFQPHNGLHQIRPQPVAKTNIKLKTK